MSRRRAGALTAILAAGGLAVLPAAPAAAAEICDQYGSSVLQNRYVVMNNRWGAGTAQCIDTTATGFRITRSDHANATNGAPAGYPAV